MPAPESPVVDATNCSASTDARGIARPQDVASLPDATDGCDSGAIEVGFFSDGFESGGTGGWSNTVG